MPREAARDKGTRYLTEGRLILILVEGDRVLATCRGEGALYRLGYAGGRWWCACPAKSENCAHVFAAKRCVAVDLSPEPWGRNFTEPNTRPRANSRNGFE